VGGPSRDAARELLLREGALGSERGWGDECELTFIKVDGEGILSPWRNVRKCRGGWRGAQRGRRVGLWSAKKKRVKKKEGLKGEGAARRLASLPQRSGRLVNCPSPQIGRTGGGKRPRSGTPKSPKDATAPENGGENRSNTKGTRSASLLFFIAGEACTIQDRRGEGGETGERLGRDQQAPAPRGRA